MDKKGDNIIKTMHICTVTNQIRSAYNELIWIYSEKKITIVQLCTETK